MKTIRCLLLAMSAAVAAVRADTIILDDGSEITGTLVDISPEGIVFETDASGASSRMRLALERIRSFQRSRREGRRPDTAKLIRDLEEITAKFSNLERMLRSLGYPDIPFGGPAKPATAPPQAAGAVSSGSKEAQREVQATRPSDPPGSVMDFRDADTYPCEITMKNGYKMNGYILDKDDVVVLTSGFGEFVLEKKEIASIVRIEGAPAAAARRIRNPSIEITTASTVKRPASSSAERRNQFTDAMISKKVRQLFHGHADTATPSSTTNIHAFNALLQISQYVLEEDLRIAYFHEDPWLDEHAIKAGVRELTAIPRMHASTFVYKFGIWLAYQNHMGRIPDLEVLDQASQTLTTMLE